MSTIRIVVFFGGRSGEHEVSIRSAAFVIGALDREKYEVIPVGTVYPYCYTHIYGFMLEYTREDNR